MIREICKAGWLQQKLEKRSGPPMWSKKTIFLPEKWYVLCIHDDRWPFLEVYPNDDAVRKHEPAESMKLKECQYITTAIEDDRTFTISFQDDGCTAIELAALSALERKEWMDMLRFKLTRLGCLESGNNLYSPFPVNGSVAASAASAASSSTVLLISESTIYPSLSTPSTDTNLDRTHEPSNQGTTAQSVENSNPERSDVMPPVSRLPQEDLYEPISHVPRPGTGSPTTLEESVQGHDIDDLSDDVSRLGYSAINKPEKPNLPPRNNGAGGIFPAPIDISHRRQTSGSEGESSSALYDTPRALLSSSPAVPLPRRSPSIPNSTLQANIERYDRLPFDMESTIRPPINDRNTASALTTDLNEPVATSVDPKDGDGSLVASHSFDNDGFDEDSSRPYANGPSMALTDTRSGSAGHIGPYSSLSGRARMVPWSVLNGKTSTQNTDSTGIRQGASSSSVQPNFGRNRSQSVTTETMSNDTRGSTNDVRMTNQPSFSRTPSPPTIPPPAPPLPLPNQMSIPVGSGRIMPLKETEVERLRSVMESPLLVKATLSLQHVVNEHGQLMGLALVDLIGFVWIAGWLKRFTKQFSAGLHVCDRVDSMLDVNGKAVAINSVARLEELLRECWKRRCQNVTLFVKRLPLGQVFVLKRNTSGDNVGIVLKAGKNEILAIEEGRAANKAGMQAQCRSAMNSSGLVNCFITEINGRPLNMFAKDHEAQKRLSAVGTELSVVVQPSDFVKELRKKLKNRKGYKEYIIG